MIATPLRVIICSEPGGASDQDGETFLAAAHRAFAGRAPGVTSVAVPNWMMGDALALADCPRPAPPPLMPVPDLLDCGLHTLVVAWVNEHSLRQPNSIKWLADVWEGVDRSNGRHGMFVGVRDERLRRDLFQVADQQGLPGLKDCQIKTWESIGEEAARPPVVALSCLEIARQLVCHGLGKSRQPLKLFISHAKNDGLSLACAGALNSANTDTQNIL